jgi:hypothetical protein
LIRKNPLFPYGPSGLDPWFDRLITLSTVEGESSAFSDPYSGCHKYVPIAIFLTDGTAMCNGLKL